MLTTELGLERKYDYLSKRFEKAFAFLRTADFSGYQEPCEIEIDGRDVYAQVQIYDTKEPEDCWFEAHRKYYDIQYMAEGEEYMGFIPLSRLEEDKGYDSQNDLEFFKMPSDYGRIALHEGDFAVVSPDDGHMPRVRLHEPVRVKKVVVKVLV